MAILLLIIVIAVFCLFLYFTSKESKNNKQELTSNEKEIIKWSGNFKKQARIIVSVCFIALALLIVSSMTINSLNSHYIKAEQKAKTVYEEASKKSTDLFNAKKPLSDALTAFIDAYAKEKGTYKTGYSRYSYYVDGNRTYSSADYEAKYNELKKEAVETDEYKQKQKEYDEANKKYEDAKSNTDKKQEKYNKAKKKREDFNSNTYRKYSYLLSIWIYFCILIAFITMLVYFYLSKMEITITNKRAFGKKAFGNRIDLPLDTISTVGTSFLKGIDIGTSAGRIHFKGIKNNVEIHRELVKLLNNRQDTKQSKSTSTSSADELKKYKALLDDKSITKDEFNAKKKQLLDL